MRESVQEIHLIAKGRFLLIVFNPHFQDIFLIHSPLSRNNIGDNIKYYFKFNH